MKLSITGDLNRSAKSPISTDSQQNQVEGMVSTQIKSIDLNASAICLDCNQHQILANFVP